MVVKMASDYGPASASPGILRPPIVYAGAILLGLLLDIAWPLPFVPRALGRTAGGALALVAVVLFVAAVKQLRTAGTPVPGDSPTTVLVRTGPYRVSRNPIYLAFSLLHLGVAAWVNSWWLLATLVATVAFVAAVVVPREERYLEERFGPIYVDYKASVRRWLPAVSIGKLVATAFLLVSIAVLIARLGCDKWRGGGFRRDGPEMPRLREVLTLRPGTSVADVGAGQGDLTVALAAEVGPSGQVFSTDIDPQALEQIRARIAGAALRNVIVVQAHISDTSLPGDCCDAVVLRRVYHHLTDPAATNLQLLRAVRTGGLLAVIDFPPTLSWLLPWPPNGVPRNRNGHGVAAGLVVDEVTAAGFALVNVIDDWPGRGPLESYCAVFGKPERQMRGHDE
ncbi:MAG TPA: methyltransferase domain-containing protein [Vicinamibacterales bacterium]|nr:methyltransferase domain-containing protein [Vicinamibacterales bacterium]